MKKGGETIERTVTAQMAYSRRNKIVTMVLLALWFLVSLGGIWIARTLNDVQFLNFPLGFYLGAQGSVIGFIILTFLYSKLMDILDSAYGLEED